MYHREEIMGLIRTWMNWFPHCKCSAMELASFINGCLGTEYGSNKIRKFIDYHIYKEHLLLDRFKVCGHVLYQLQN